MCQTPLPVTGTASRKRALLFRKNLFAHLLSALSKNPFNYMQPLLEQPISIHVTTAHSMLSYTID